MFVHLNFLLLFYFFKGFSLRFDDERCLEAGKKIGILFIYEIIYYKCYQNIS